MVSPFEFGVIFVCARNERERIGGSKKEENLEALSIQQFKARGQGHTYKSRHSRVAFCLLCGGYLMDNSRGGENG